MCNTLVECIYNFQTLLSGVLAIVAALATGIIIWKTAYLPIQHKKQEECMQTERRRHYVALVLSRNFLQLAVRAKQAQSTVIVTKAANANVTESVRGRVMLKFDPIMDDSELMSLFPTDVLTSIVDLRKVTEDHNFDMERAGGAFGDDNFGEQITRRLESIYSKCYQLSSQLCVFEKGYEKGKHSNS